MRLLHRLARELNKGILLSTHELDLALQVADEVWLMQHGFPLHKGAPEDLILEGIFEAVFAKEDVVFDRGAGIFRIPPEGSRQIRLKGSGIAAFWTRRALQREGFIVGEPEAGPAAGYLLTITEEQQGRTQWVWQDQPFTSIAALLQALNRR
jgi:iron complex transport system ATP-binding protein